MASAIVGLIVLQLAAAPAIVEIMVRRRPQSIARSAKHNCYRLDGSWSARRAGEESSALWKMRIDLNAVLVVLILSIDGAAFWVHSTVIPIPLGFRALSTFDSDTDSWKQRLRETGIVEQYVDWKRTDPTQSAAAIEQSMRRAWGFLPAVLICVPIALFAVWRLIRRAYLLALRDLAEGIERRKQRNADRDLVSIRVDESVLAS
ncbi:MAG: hypothetical protein U0892_22430 [Pirellulales bacterium]